MGVFIIEAPASWKLPSVPRGYGYGVTVGSHTTGLSMSELLKFIS